MNQVRNTYVEASMLTLLAQIPLCNTPAPSVLLRKHPHRHLHTHLVFSSCRGHSNATPRPSGAYCAARSLNADTVGPATASPHHTPAITTPTSLRRWQQPSPRLVPHVPFATSCRIPSALLLRACRGCAQRPFCTSVTFRGHAGNTPRLLANRPNCENDDS